MIRNDSLIRSALFALVLPATACASTTDNSPEDAITTAGTAGTAGGGSAGGSGGSGGTITIDAGTFDAAADGKTQIDVPVRSLPGLSSMTFFERTGGEMPTPYTFQVNGSELTTRLEDPLGKEFDIPGADTEYYDVYYSNNQGEFDIDGSYLTISGVFEMTAPWGGGLNLAEISLNYDGKAAEFGNYVASFVSQGDNKDDDSVENCIDGNLQTETTMGNTAGSSTRLRLTLGFLSSSGPPPPIK